MKASMFSQKLIPGCSHVTDEVQVRYATMIGQGYFVADSALIGLQSTCIIAEHTMPFTVLYIASRRSRRPDSGLMVLLI